MRIIVNEQEITFPSSITVDQLLSELDKPRIGTAIAINTMIIPRNEWAAHQIENGDNIVLFQAIAGG